MKFNLFTAGFVMGFAAFPVVSLIREGKVGVAAGIAGLALITVAWLLWPEEPPELPGHDK